MHDFFIIGHRGAAGEKFENSLSGFKHALTLDIDAIELDVRAHSGEHPGHSNMARMRGDLAEDLL